MLEERPREEWVTTPMLERPRKEWIEWRPHFLKKMPVYPNDTVSVRFRDGYTPPIDYADAFNWWVDPMSPLAVTHYQVHDRGCPWG